MQAQKVYQDIVLGIGMDARAAKADMPSAKGKSRRKNEPLMVDQYSRDLTAYAREGKLDPVIGRHDEISAGDSDTFQKNEEQSLPDR